MPYSYIIHQRVYDAIVRFYENVAKKNSNTYSFELMAQNIIDAYNAIYQIENTLPRRKPIISRWRGLFMASYMVEGKTRWDYAYRIEGGTVYVEYAYHAQNMSGYSSPMQSNHSTKNKYRKLTKKPLFGYSFVMNDKKEYNLIDNNGRLITDWFKAIKPLQKPYGKYQIIAYINVKGWLCALGYNGKVYNLNRTWREAYMEGIQKLLSKDIITESIEGNRNTIRLTEAQFKRLLTECITKIINEIA